eukprot:gene4030-5767_t
MSARREIKYGMYASNGGRDYQEDRASAFQLNIENKNDKFFFGIFDGHGGKIVSSHLAQTFHERLIQAEIISKKPLLALQDSWKEMDGSCFDECLSKEKEQNLANFPQDGSTATVCYISGNDVYVCNCGDSSAYSIMTDGFTKVMTEEHITTNNSEVTRLTKNGGKLVANTIRVPGPFPLCFMSVHKTVGKPRVHPGRLMITRSFGDFYAKYEQFGGMKNVVIPDHGKIKYMQLQEGGLKYIVLASDGIWDVLSIGEVNAIISSKVPLNAIDIASAAYLAKPRNSLIAVSPDDNSDALKSPREKDEAIKTSLRKLYVSGTINCELDNVDTILSHCAKEICEQAVNSNKWKALGCPADNASCIIVSFRHPFGLNYSNRDVERETENKSNIVSHLELDSFDSVHDK